MISRLLLFFFFFLPSHPEIHASGPFALCLAPGTLFPPSSKAIFLRKPFFLSSLPICSAFQPGDPLFSKHFPNCILHPLTIFLKKFADWKTSNLSLKTFRKVLPPCGTRGSFCQACESELSANYKFLDVPYMPRCLASHQLVLSSQR